MQQNIFYHSGNVANLTHTLVANVAPNYTYSIAVPFTLHHMRDNSNPSGLVYSNIVHYSGSLSFTAPPDNVSASFELVRVGTSATDNEVTLYYSNFDYENYDNYNYSFYAKAYENVERTTLYSSQKSNIVTKDSSGNFRLTISDLTTIGKYFQINTFKNETADCNVYTGPGTSSLLSFNVYDVRGLAYMRDYRYDAEFVEIANISGYTNSTGQGMVLLSADGNRMVSIQEKTNGTVQITGYKWNMLLSKWDVFSTTSKNGFSKNHRYVYNSLIDGSHISSFSSAFSPNGDFFVIGSGSTLSVVAFDASFTEKASIAFSRTIHCVTMSADGKNILVSGNHATDSSDLNYIGQTGGTAKIYSFDGTNLNEVDNLSSDLLPVDQIHPNTYYGSNSVISGDGKTALVIGSMVRYNSRGFLWKFNNFDNKWVYVTRINIPLGVRGYTPCSMSHDGKAFVVNDSPHERLASIFETSDYLTWNVIPISIFQYLVCDCDISGDGKTALFSLWKKFDEKKDFLLYYKVGSSWIQKMNHVFSDRTKDDIYQHCSLSYDGSTMTMIDTTNLEISTLRLDKNVTINAVYDYFNKYSTFYDFNYDFDYNTISVPDWNIKTSTQLQTDSVSFHGPSVKQYGYGHWDATSISADGRYVLIGSPFEKKVYLHDTVDGIIQHTFTRTDSYFGLRCAMDDFAVYVAIAAYDKIYFYKRFDNTFQAQSNLNHGYGQNIFQFKMSKNGLAVCMTSAIPSTVIKKWTTTNEWGNVTSYTLDGGTRRVSAFDLSYDGTYVAAGQQTSGQVGDFTIFNGSTKKVDVTISTATSPEQRHMHSVAITGHPDVNNEFKILVGTCFPETEKLNSANYFVLNYNTSSNSLSGDTVRKTVSNLPTAGRYGRTAAMSYDGNFMLLSGTVENPNDSDFSGSAVIMNSSGIKQNTFEFSGVASLNKPGSQANSIEYRFDKYGSGCRISSDNKNVLISGGGYAFMYRIQP